MPRELGSLSLCAFGMAEAGILGWPQQCGEQMTVYSTHFLFLLAQYTGLANDRLLIRSDAIAKQWEWNFESLEGGHLASAYVAIIRQG